MNKLDGGVMDIQKEREVFEAWVGSSGRSIERFSDGSYKSMTLDKEWEAWQAAKAQAVSEWISVEGKLPETEPNTDGVVCAVVCSLGNVYRARYMHDVDVGIDVKYWSEFSVGYNGVEHEHYEINAKITHWMPLPDAPQEPAND